MGAKDFQSTREFTDGTLRLARDSVSARPTSQDGRDQRGQQAPSVDGHVEDGEELLPLVALEEMKGMIRPQ